MPGKQNSDADKVCPQAGRPIGPARRYRWLVVFYPVVGLVCLVWFLMRVIPKPSRATYPCQRVAAPLAGSFVVWIAGALASIAAYWKSRRFLERSRYVLAAVFAVLGVAAIWGALCLNRDSPAQAASNGVFVASDPANSPIGTAQGIYPGRVAWVHDPAATSWDARSNYWWSSEFSDQAVISDMLARVINGVAGGTNVIDSWDRLFRDLNRRKGKGDVGYEAAENIALKINLNSGGNSNRLDASPQMVWALLDELVNQVGVPQNHITIFDAQRSNISAVSNHCKPTFPDVKYNQWGSWVANAIAFSSSDVSGSDARRLPQAVVQADYFINMALLKRHSRFSSNWSDGDGQTAVTLCGKNNFGTVGSPSAMHVCIRDWNRGMASYNGIVDLIGSKYMGGNTVLYLLDGLYAGDIHDAVPRRWHMEPFNNDWPSSVFASQNAIAIDSVGLDFLNAEWGLIANADNYLHEAALADNPPSGTVYRPDGVRLASLGVHEHWNNSVDKQYSRNLGTGAGIELVTPATVSEDGPVQNLTTAVRYDSIRPAVQDANDGDEIVAAPGFYYETVDFGGKRLTVRSEDPDDPNIVAATIIASGLHAVAFSGGEDANSVLAGFTITGTGQGIFCADASPTILNCQIANNAGPGVKLAQWSDPTLINCIIAGNGGAGIEMWAPRPARTIKYNCPTLRHCTIVGNVRQGISGDKPTVLNSILYANGVDGNTPQIDGDAPVVGYCDVQGGYPGMGNLDVDPGFVVPGYWADASDPNLPAAPDALNAVWMPGDYHLRPDSLCIDAGDPTAAAGIPLDFEGHLRTIGPRPDLGADEAR